MLTYGFPEGIHKGGDKKQHKHQPVQHQGNQERALRVLLHRGSPEVRVETDLGEVVLFDHIDDRDDAVVGNGSIAPDVNHRGRAPC